MRLVALRQGSSGRLRQMVVLVLLNRNEAVFEAFLQAEFAVVLVIVNVNVNVIVIFLSCLAWRGTPEV